MKQHDVVIVGDGVVGLTLAHALAQRGMNIAIFLNNSAAIATSTLATKYDVRVSAVTQASERIFKHIGVWSSMVERRVSPFRDMHIWDALGAGQLHFDSAWVGQSHLGHIIENSVMIAALREKLADYPNLTCYENYQLTDLMMPAGGVIIKTDQGNIFAKLLLGADGANSWVRQKAGFTLEQDSYNQTAIVTTVQTELPHQETAWQRFLPTGPLAFLPLNHPHYCSIVWSCTPEKTAEILAYTDEQFCRQLMDAFDFKLGKIISVEPRQNFPLIMRHADRYIMPHIALVGDAAHTIHPLAGQGLNQGLLDAAVLVDVIAKTLALGRPLGMESLLRQYERERRTANLLMIKLMDGLKQLFSNEHPVLMTVRNTGLNITEKLPWIKMVLMQQAMGNQLKLPTLAQEV